MRPTPRSILLSLCLTLFTVCCNAQTTPTPAQVPSRIPTAIDDNNRIQLPGNVHPLARLAFDRGPAADAVIDVQWSGAVAPGARIDFVTSAPTETPSGVHLSALYIVDHNLDPVMSESFGGCEQGLGVALNNFYNSLWEQASAQGITVILSAGDGGSAGCDDFNTAQVPITNGVVQAQLILPLIGVHQLTAQYSGDTLNQQSTSPSVIAVVTGQGSVSVTGTTGPVAHSVVVNVIIQ